MDIDDFLDKEVSDLGLETRKDETSTSVDLPAIKDGEQYSLIENIRAQMLKGDIDLAEQSYLQLWNSLFQQKLRWNKEVYEQLSALSKQFQSAINQSFDSTKRKADHISDLINRGRSSLREGKKDIPFKIYAEIEEMGNSIPDAFFEQKRIIQEQSMEYYRELRNSTDNELLTRVAGLIQEVNRLIDKVNISIGSKDMVNSILNYNKCIELYSQIPEGFLRHKNFIAIRLLQVYKSLSIYNEVTTLQKELAAYPQQPQFSDRASVQLATLQKEFKASVQNTEEYRVPDLATKPKTLLLKEKKDMAKKNIEKGFYNEASKDIEEALKIEPNDVEAKAINAKIKTLQ